jgi:XapX domain-containing protein
MKWIVGFAIAFLLGAGTRYFDIPAPAPPTYTGALLILAITAGYDLTGTYLDGREDASETEASAQVDEENAPEPASE